MHACLCVDEIIRLLASELITIGGRGTAVALACCCKNFEDPVLDELWKVQDQLPPLLRFFSRKVWDDDGGDFSFKRIPTEAQWTRFQKYARRIRTLKVNPSQNPLPPNVLSVLQHRTLNAPLLPGLKAFVCREATATFVPFIPSFLSPRTTIINVRFTRFTREPPSLMIASMIATFSTLCPNLQEISLRPLPKNSTIGGAISEMLLGCNRNTLRRFDVDSLLTKPAGKVLYQLPNLSKLRSVLLGYIPLSKVLLPNLSELNIVYRHGHDWLRAFHGATLSKLTEVVFHAECELTGDFLEAFEDVALTTCVSATLSAFKFHTSRSWNPNYYSLLSFKQLRELVVESSCHDGCSSRVDDEIVVTLARALPKLEVLRLGSEPCPTPTGVTVKGLVELAFHGISLTTLRVHIQADSLVQAAVGGVATSPNGEPATREECALATLEVGDTLIPEESALTVALALLHIFPHISNIKYANPQWDDVVYIIKLSSRLSNRIGSLAHYSRDALDTGYPPLNG